jgi:hypothetical protein
MGSSGKKRTTMAKLNRESKQRERRQDKQARKEARKQSPAEHSALPGETLDAEEQLSSFGLLAEEPTRVGADDDPTGRGATPANAFHQ